MSKRRDLFKADAYDEINVTPLLDLAWTLLVVFILAVTATIQGIKVDLPKASNVPSLSKPRTKAITITQEIIYLDAYPVSMTELETRLRQLKAQDPELPVVVKGDAKVDYERVIQVLDLLANLDITKLGLVTKAVVR